MYLSIGLEIGDPKHAIGIVVPALNTGNYGCYSAADTEQDIIPNTKEAISLLLADMVECKPETVMQIEDLGLRHYQSLKEYKDFNNWGMIEFDLSPYLKSKSA